MANLGYIQLTRKCNQNCLFCSNPENEQFLSFEQIKEKINDLKEKSYEGVIFTGGEPTLNQNLSQAIEYANKKGIEPRLITNGQKISDKAFLKDLISNGLKVIHISFYSYQPRVQNYLSQNNDSYYNLISALKNSQELNLAVNLNTVINKYNSDHLDKNVAFILKYFPNIYHFVFNNLDPFMNRASENTHTIPNLKDFEKSLNRALKLLSKFKKSFRIERVPLCFLDGFEQFSTETRKIVKNEKRTVYFLDQKGIIEQQGNGFEYNKADVCKKCSLNKICAGLYAMDQYYNSSELKPIFKDPELIINKIIA